MFLTHLSLYWLKMGSNFFRLRYVWSLCQDLELRVLMSAGEHFASLKWVLMTGNQFNFWSLPHWHKISMIHVVYFEQKLEQHLHDICTASSQESKNIPWESTNSGECSRHLNEFVRSSYNYSSRNVRVKTTYDDLSIQNFKNLCNGGSC